jgi:hypothetical protein
MNEFDDAYDALRAHEWEAFRARYERHREYLLEAEGEEANDDFIDCLWTAFEAMQPGPLLFEESDDRLGILTEVLDECATDERTWLKQNVEHLGVRCEARLCGTAPEGLALTLSDSDRERLGEFVMETLLQGLPVVA